jgi:hypothetical protein
MKNFTVVVNDCATPPAHAIKAVRGRDTAYGKRNFTLKVTDIVHGLPNRLNGREMDWLEILGYLFATDLACERGDGDVDWSRSIDLWIPVRDPTFWDQRRTAFEQIWMNLTYDSIRIHFVEDKEPVPLPRMGRVQFPDHDCVALLSGGQDSFVGALELIEAGQRPLLVSHSASSAVNGAQNAVEAALHELDSNLVRLKLGAHRTPRSDFPGDEPSQRSRTFLFVGAAALVGALGESQQVLLNENGIMALHVPMTAARIGSLSTHTASPPILAKMQALANDVFGVEMTVDNRLVNITKPEVVGRAVELGKANHMISTVSCWQIGRTSSHCGICSPCIMRRISNEYNDVADIDYAADIFNDSSALNDSKARDNISHFVALIRDLEQLDTVQLEYEYPELFRSTPAMTLGDAIGLHRRWADQASSVLFGHPVPAGL